MSEPLNGANLPLLNHLRPPVASKKPYAPPQLMKRGTVSELTQGGGSVIDDGLGTLEGHL